MQSERKELFEVYYGYLFLFIIITLSNAISIRMINGKAALLVGFIWMIATIALYFVFVRKNVEKKIILIYSIINAVFAGVTISALYTMKNVTPFFPALFVVLFAIGMAIHYKLFIRVKRKEIFVRVNIGITIFLIISSIYILTQEHLSLGCGMLFFGIVYLCFNIAVQRNIKKGIKPINILAYASLLMFGGLLAAVVAIITNGDAVDAFDAGWIGESKKEKS